MIALVLLAQAAAATTAPVGPTVLMRRPCPEAVEGEVVVCARRGQQGPRLRPLPPPPTAASRDPLGFRLPGGGTGRVHAFQHELPGATGQGLAVTLSIPFGKPKPGK